MSRGLRWCSEEVRRLWAEEHTWQMSDTAHRNSEIHKINERINEREQLRMLLPGQAVFFWLHGFSLCFGLV